MIRYIGAALVVAATGTMGLMGVWRLRRACEALEGLIASLQIMESEICARMTPMREVLELLSQTAPRGVRGLYRRAFEGMGDLGRRSFYSIWKSGAEEQRVLEELGLCLGRYDVREQAEAIARVRSMLEPALDRAEEERRRDTKLHAFFGVASGLFAVMILL